MTIHYTESEVRQLLKQKAEQIAGRAMSGTYTDLRFEIENIRGLVEALPRKA